MAINFSQKKEDKVTKAISDIGTNIDDIAIKKSSKKSPAVVPPVATENFKLNDNDLNDSFALQKDGFNGSIPSKPVSYPFLKDKQNQSKKSPDNKVPQDFFDDDDDDFGDIQNKSKILPDGEEFSSDEEASVDIDDDLQDIPAEDFSDSYEDKYSHHKDKKKTSNKSSEKTVTEPPKKKKTLEDIQMEKMHYLSKIERMKKNDGYFPTKDVNMNTNLETIKQEYEMMYKDKRREKSILSWREDVTLFASATEKGNKWMKEPVYLTGWSKKVHKDNTDGYYDDIYEDLHDLYGGKSMMHPIIRLGYELGKSGVRWHFSRKLMNESPDIYEVLKKDPALYKQVMDKVLQEGKLKMTARGDYVPSGLVPPAGIAPTTPKGLVTPSSFTPDASKKQTSTDMKGPSISPEDILNQPLENINDPPDELRATNILPNELPDEENVSVKINKTNTRGRKKKDANVVSIEL